jgi:acyl-CoA thioester hydrolase
MVQTEIKVRVSETDLLGVVYYGNFFTYFEVARFDYLASCGCSSEEISNFLKNSYILEAHCIYKSPARVLDIITLEIDVYQIREKTFRFTYRVKKQSSGDLIAEGYTVGVFVDASGKSIPIPKWFRKKIAPQRSE